MRSGPRHHPLNLVVSMLPTPVARPWAVRTFMLIGVKLRGIDAGRDAQHYTRGLPGRPFTTKTQSITSRASQSQPSGQRHRNCTHVRVRCKAFQHCQSRSTAASGITAIRSAAFSEPRRSDAALLGRDELSHRRAVLPEGQPTAPAATFNRGFQASPTRPPGAHRQG